MEAFWKRQALGRKGFTLIELIVVIAIIAILAVILIPRFTGFTQSAKKSNCLSDARNLLLAGEALKAENTAFVAANAGGDMKEYAGDAAGTKFKGVFSTVTSWVDWTYTITDGTTKYAVTAADGVLGDVTVTP